MDAFGKDRLYTLGIILIVLSVSTGLFSSYIYYRQKSHLVANHQARIQIEAELIGAILQNLIAKDRFVEAKNIMSAWTNSHRYITLLEAVLDHNKVLFSYHNLNSGDNGYVLTKHIRYEDHTLDITLAYDYKIFQATLTELRHNLLLLSSYLILFMGITLWFLLFRQLIRPMRLEIRRQTQVMRDMIAYTEGLFNAMNAHIAILDINGDIISTNQAWQTFANNNGYKDDPAMIGQFYPAIAANLYQSAELRTAWEKGVTEVALGLSQQYVCEYGCTDQGKARWFIMRVLPVMASNPPTIIVTHEDVTSIKESELALVESEWHLRQINLVYRALSASNILLSKAKEEIELVQGVADIIYSNCNKIPVWIGYAIDNIDKQIKPVAFKGFSEEYIQRLKVSWNNYERGQNPVGTSIRERRPVIVNELQNQSTDDIDYAKTSVFPSTCASFPLLHGDICLGAIVIHSAYDDTFSDQEVHLFNELAANLAFGILAIRNRLAMQEALQALDKLSTTDKLTQLYNRAKLDEVLEDASKRGNRYDISLFSIILTDIDYFKRVNDTHGHQAGDKTLVQFAQIMRNNLRETDIAGRWGGEEFLIICPHTNGQGAWNLAEKLRRILECSPMEKVGIITASFGVAEFIHGDDVDSLLGRADDALYTAKYQGRNMVVMI